MKGLKKLESLEIQRFVPDVLELKTYQERVSFLMDLMEHIKTNISSINEADIVNLANKMRELCEIGRGNAASGGMTMEQIADMGLLPTILEIYAEKLDELVLRALPVRGLGE